MSILGRKTSLVVALSATLGIALTSCASTGAPASTNSSPSTAAEAGQPAPYTTQLVAQGKLTCASSGAYPPFSSRDKSGKLIGFDIDMCSAIAADLKLTPEPVTGEFDTLVAGLSSGRYDAIIGSMSPTDERKKVVDFTNDYYQDGAVLFVQSDSTITGVADLKDATIGVALGTTFATTAHGLKGVKDVKTYPADIDALNDLSAGRLDGVITDELIGLYAAKHSGLSVKSVGDEIAPDPAAIAVRKTTPALLSAINKALDNIKSNGVYAKISETYFGRDISK